MKSPNSVVITEETAKKYFGNEEALGKVIKIDIPGIPDLKVTGVLENIPGNSHMHFDLLVSLSTLINDQNRAFFETMFSNQFYTYLLLKENYPASNLEKRLPEFREKHLNDEQKKRLHKFFLQPLRDIHLHAPDDPYSDEYEFFEENVDNLYKPEKRLSEVIKSFTILAIVIACPGLFGLASFTAEQRTKEIGIRKVLGASVSEVVLLLSKEYSKLLIIANIIAVPIIIYLMNQWLDPKHFFYRISIGIIPFVIAAILVFAVAFFSIIFQSTRAALANPVDALKYE